MLNLEANIENVQGKIEDAAARAGRDAADIRLVAITKTHPPEVVRAAYELGLRDFGENRVFEGVEKQSHLQDLDEAIWHMVGHIQSRKSSEVPEHFKMVHSVDRPKIARYLDKHAQAGGIRLPVLLECNVSGEKSKYGWELSDQSLWRDAAVEFNALLDLKNLEIRGLMTMAPWVEDESIVRKTFIQLRSLRNYLQDALEVNWPELSMGMTDDYEIAIEEGATLLRIGRAIFGPRQS
ncbi:MAG: YggS family pyridoxal phosphate-dependent enzyme [Anaerolineales bacterium]|jgi:pyridoxal phosphate enzyme (YggS family)